VASLPPILTFPRKGGRNLFTGRRAAPSPTANLDADLHGEVPSPLAGEGQDGGATRKRPSAITFAVLILLSTVASCSRRADQPNVILIVVDTLRADRLGVYGNTRGHTPELDAIAAQGVAFDRALAQAPWTQPSMASLFCACNPAVHQVLDYDLALQSLKGARPKVAVLDGAFQTLAESLHDAGYQTAAFVANPFVLKEYGFAQGFDHFDASFAGNTTRGEVVNDAALTWLDRHRAAQPLFLYLHYMDVHGPYDARPELLDPLLDRVERSPDTHLLSPQELERLGYLRQPPRTVTDPARHERLSPYREYWEARYDGGVREADRAIAALRERLSAAGLWQDAYVIVTADHGESLCEHGQWDHGRTMYHPELRVPLLMRWPNHLPAGTRVTDTVRLIDLPPTLAEQLALKPTWQQQQGRSLAPQLAGRSADPAPALATGVKFGADQRAIHLGDWKLIVMPASGQYALYDVWADPLEQHDRAGEKADVVQRLRAALAAEDAASARIRAQGPSTPQHAELDAAQHERLRALGYVE
jgi:arylsulfatase A-like enzyme